MIKDKSTFFKKLALVDSLKENLLSIILAKHPDIDLSVRESYFDRISPFFKRYKIEDRESIRQEVNESRSEIDDWENLDLRIKKVKLQSVRGYPQSDIPFGIDFTDGKENPQSMVILGSNGSGKSSIYSALEFTFCKKVGEAQLRSSIPINANDEYFKDYLRNFNFPFSNSTCVVEMMQKNFTLNGDNIPKSVRLKINPNSHFISDYDIYENGQLDYRSNSNSSFQNLIAKSIGLSELLETERQLYSFSSYGRRKETTQVSDLNRIIGSDKTLIESNETAIAQKKAQIENFEEEQKDTLIKKDFKEQLAILNQIKPTNFSFSFDYQQVTKLVELFTQLYNEYTAVSKKNGNLSEIQFLNTGLSLLKEADSCPFCNDSKLTKAEINASVVERIKKIEAINKIVNELNRATTILTEMLNSLSSSIISIRARATKEINSIKEKTEFNDLSIAANEFVKYSGEYFSNDFFTSISNFQETPAYISDKQNYLFQLTSKNKSFINNELNYYLETISKYEGKRKSILNAIEADISKKSETTSAEVQIAVLKNEISTLERQVVTAKKSIETNTIDLIKLSEQVELFQKIQTETKRYAKQFHIELSKEIQSVFDPIKNIVKNILDKYLYENDLPVDLRIELQEEEVDEESGDVISEIITAYIAPKASPEQPLPVNKYFNSFHYRLFCTMVGISIAIASRKNTGINMPVVLDDIFYASDFENSATIEEFIKKLFDLFKEFTPSLELQLILFTHDQLIFESAISASSQNTLNNITFAKLFPYSEAELQADFKNLVYKIPTYLPTRIMQNKLATI